MIIKNPITLNNSDGFTEKQKDVLNSMIVAERNRWDRKSQQKVNKSRLVDGIDEISGVVTSAKSYMYNNFVTMHFFLHSIGLSSKKVKIITAKKEIDTLLITGNKYSPYDMEGEIGTYISFSFDGKDIYAELLDEECKETFYCDLNMKVKNG